MKAIETKEKTGSPKDVRSFELRRILNVRETCCYLGVSRTTLTQWVWDGLIPRFMPPCRKWLFDRNDLDLFIERRKQTMDSGKIGRYRPWEQLEELLKETGK
jgi:excisionase family DNA binding protein